MKCRDVMTKNFVCCLPEDNVGAAARMMRRERVGSVPVVTDELRKELVGIVSDRDLAFKVVGDLAAAMSGPLMYIGDRLGLPHGEKIVVEQVTSGSAYELAGVIVATPA